MLCHVGMFAPVKIMNFDRYFASVVKKHPDSVLLLVGTGSETEKIREKVSGLGLSKRLSLPDDVRMLKDNERGGRICSSFSL